ncbi:MAG: nucleotidyltransferase domain-containing protein [Pseudomonadota bacterium]
MTNDDINRDDLIRRFVDDGTSALLLVGSRARGDHAPSSDIDLARHVKAEGTRHPTLYMNDADGRLISLKTFDPASEEEGLMLPGRAVWQAPTLASAVILYDRDGDAARLVDKARRFDWADLGAAPDRHVAREVTGYAEETLKIVDGMERGIESQIIYATMGIVLGLAEAMVVHRRGFIISENRLFESALDLMAAHKDWASSMRRAAGFGDAGSFDRAAAALTLYAETVALVRPLLDEDQCAVAEGALSRRLL